MRIPLNAGDDLALDEGTAELVGGGRARRHRSTATHASVGVAAVTAPVQQLPAEVAPQAPLPPSPFGDDCITIRYPTDGAASA
jgi:hypothetical protein